MKLPHETATATLIQFMVLGLLNIGNGLNSIVTTCHNNGHDCISNTIVSIIFFILTVMWFGLVCFFGYMSQERRGKLWILCLAGAEGLIALIALFNAKHHTDILALFTSLIDLLFAIWILILSLRLWRSGGQRITRNRPRQRRKPT